MDTLANLKAFLAVAGSGSFSAAARSLDLAPSVVTKRVDQLERAVRRPLFRRTTRRVSLTEAGERLLPRVRASVAEVEEVLAALARPDRDLEGHLRVKMPTTLGILYLGPVLAAFQSRHPRVSLDVVLTDRPLNPIEEGFDLALGAFPQAFRGALDVPLCPLERIACASPAFLAANGTPQHPRDLAAFDALSFLPTGSTWTFGSRSGPISVTVNPRLSANDNHVILAAAREGNGIAVLPRYVAGPALRAGALVQVLAAFPLSEMWLKAVVPENRARVPRLVALLDFLREHIGGQPPWEREE
ncbi:LysR family transcriptional regulator [Roseomonas sp. KE2513]|uniref:LysR family transcriptional regulator n=1 Tax=Roseomonas sp. KE2513 TaxID=2479202 RepID=UPI0018E042D9|nr:LysR family transcriptional regulator [Roseomonas sp. KE2513]MBI0535900.1 LysR family transcriptional regulator [Roseomonas sp. KE2513]